MLTTIGLENFDRVREVDAGRRRGVKNLEKDQKTSCVSRYGRCTLRRLGQFYTFTSRHLPTSHTHKSLSLSNWRWKRLHAASHDHDVSMQFSEMIDKHLNSVILSMHLFN